MPCALLFVSWALIACSDDQSSSGFNVDVDCGQLGSLPASVRYMEGYFTFNGETRYPLDLSLAIDSRSFTGQAHIEDSQQDFFGLCGGRWDEEGILEGHCLLRGSFDLEIELTGSVGEEGGCGSWSNTAGQTGEWRVAKSDSALSAGESEYACEIGSYSCACTSGGGMCDPELRCLFGLCVRWRIEEGCQEDADCSNHGASLTKCC